MDYTQYNKLHIKNEIETEGHGKVVNLPVCEDEWDLVFNNID